MAKNKTAVVADAPANDNGNGTNVVNEQAPVVQIAEPTSEKLTELKQQKSDVLTKQKDFIVGGGDMESADYNEINMELYRINNLIKAELANIDKSKREQEIAEKRNERVKLAENLVRAVCTVLGVNYDDLTEEQRAGFKEPFDVVATELLTRYSSSSPAKKAADGDKPSGSRGAIGKEIVELFKQYRDIDGLSTTDAIKKIQETKTELAPEGHSRGTTGAVVLAYRREIGEVE